jgi:hypothetical protein
LPAAKHSLKQGGDGTFIAQGPCKHTIIKNRRDNPKHPGFPKSAHKKPNSWSEANKYKNRRSGILALYIKKPMPA